MTVSEGTKTGEATIQDEDIERARRLIGVPRPIPTQPFNRVSDMNSMSHWAFGLGDDNPLWHDPDYAQRTRWHGLPGHPMYFVTTGENRTPKPATPEKKALHRGLFRGIGEYASGAVWHWYRPIFPGERVFHQQAIESVEVKDHSSFSGRRAVIVTWRDTYADRAGLPYATVDEAFVFAERGGSQKAESHDKIARRSYTPDEIEAIDELYAAEERRGATPRYWEDVRVGDELTPVVKGPLSVGDIIGFHVGWGMGRQFGIGPLRYGWAHRQKVPAFWAADSYGVPGSMQRLHWDADRAQELGLPAAYDYGRMRTTWLTHLVTNWMGDDGWIVALHNEYRGFNFIGDTTICDGRVTGKRNEGLNHVVDLDITCTNQRETVTSPGTATVALPSREHGPVCLTPPPEKLLRVCADMAARYAR